MVNCIEDKNALFLHVGFRRRNTDKRDRFIAELRDVAKQRGLSFSVNKKRGKGGHATVYIGDRLTTLPSREIDPATAAKIRKHLGLA
ncbi:type II toxin-antitoxin system HicA family toxin [Beijerinckia sp. L45]|uniref:type II toxin-antitoxin system HicA family toxin n=1 Tax=Beijerinckia sp. L45 TaxID=1641855 RepID=UPI00131D1C5A|nr:type II toxin-antitoxin system HicA family toxin [Beijerinckia sp. L45]